MLNWSNLLIEKVKRKLNEADELTVKPMSELKLFWKQSSLFYTVSCVGLYIFALPDYKDSSVLHQV